jgi:hypothetical protein
LDLTGAADVATFANSTGESWKFDLLTSNSQAWGRIVLPEVVS